MPKRKQLKDKIEDLLELPKEITSKVPRITMVGFQHILIENYKGIVEYDENYIRLSTSIGNIIIQGMNLNLNQITSDDVEINGKITNAEFLNINEDK